MEILRQTFHTVRLVSPEECLVYQLDENGLSKDAHCYKLWGRSHPCAYCLSKQALISHACEAKLEYIDRRTFIVISKYIQLKNQDLILEIITDLTDISSLGQEKSVTSELRRLQEENSRLMKDPLTGCYSRHYLNATFHQCFREARKRRLELCIALVDIDNFKAINDEHGHAIGDEVLQSCCQFWMKYFDLQHNSFLTRYGGDEFIIISIANSYEEFCQRLLSLGSSMRKTLVLDDGRSIPFSFSIGCACLSETDPDEKNEDIQWKQLFALADERLYIGKRLHGNRTVIASSPLQNFLNSPTD